MNPSRGCQGKEYCLRGRVLKWAGRGPRGKPPLAEIGEFPRKRSRFEGGRRGGACAEAHGRWVPSNPRGCEEAGQ